MPFLWEDEGLLDILEYRLGPLLKVLVFVGRKLHCWARGHSSQVMRMRPKRYGAMSRYRRVCLRCGATTKVRAV